MGKLTEAILDILKANSAYESNAFCSSGYQGEPAIGNSSQAPFYFKRREYSLIGFPDDIHKEQICQGAGREWDKDIFALRSSCALAFNLFGNGPVLLRKGKIPITGDFFVEYERKLPTLARYSKPAYPDVCLTPCSKQNAIIFFEIKKLEWLDLPDSSISDKYLNTSHYKVTKSEKAKTSFVELFRAITDSKSKKCCWKRYDALQMAKHLLGCYNYSEAATAPRPNVLLVNCIWELGNRFASSAIPEALQGVYRQALDQENTEFDAFYTRVKPVLDVFKSELGVTADIVKLSVQELIEQLFRQEPTNWKERLVSSNCL